MKIEYRVLWCEVIGGQVMPFSGRVTSDFEDAWREAELKRRSYNFHGIMVEARQSSECAKPWPPPWDELEELRKGINEPR